MLDNKGGDDAERNRPSSSQTAQSNSSYGPKKGDTTSSKTDKGFGNEGAGGPPGKAGGPPVERPPKISFFKLFKYSSGAQKLQMFVGLIAAVISGAAAPSIAIIFGEIIAIFDPNNSKDEVKDGIILLFQFIGILCAVMWIFGYMQFAFLQASAERLSFDLRTLYLRALLRQETEYFEKQQVESIPSQIAEWFSSIGEGVGEKFG